MKNKLTNKNSNNRTPKITISFIGLFVDNFKSALNSILPEKIIQHKAEPMYKWNRIKTDDIAENSSLLSDNKQNYGTCK